MNTEKAYWNAEGYRDIPGMEVHHLTKEEFDHGGTRNLAAWYSESDIMIFMTDDAVPQDEHLIEESVKGSGSEGTGGRDGGGGFMQSSFRQRTAIPLSATPAHFNYSDTSMIKTKKSGNHGNPRPTLRPMSAARIAKTFSAICRRVCEQYHF